LGGGLGGGFALGGVVEPSLPLLLLLLRRGARAVAVPELVHHEAGAAQASDLRRHCDVLRQAGFGERFGLGHRRCVLPLVLLGPHTQKAYGRNRPKRASHA
jgi:hypothetical protein